MGEWKTPADLKYADSDEWFAVAGDVVTIGITDYAQDQLNDIVYVEFRDPAMLSRPAALSAKLSRSRRPRSCTAQWPAKSSKSIPPWKTSLKC